MVSSMCKAETSSGCNVTASSTHQEQQGSVAVARALLPSKPHSKHFIFCKWRVTDDTRCLSQMATGFSLTLSFNMYVSCFTYSLLISQASPCCPFPLRGILFVLSNLSREFRSSPAYVLSVVVPSLLCLVLRGGLGFVISSFLCVCVVLYVS